ncbi:MAG: leucine-rich repeat domain-containing protein, partial [Clostridia bacterium]|nr:leucine-rich repeat domain-containing protein [Clostridia bacterium]
TAPFPGCYSLVIKYSNSKFPDNWVSTTFSGAPEIEIPVVFNSYSNEIADDGNVYVVANNGVQYALKDGIAKVAGSSYIFGDVIIANNIIYKDMNYHITRIGFGSFSVCSNLTSIYIPSSVTSINEVAFEGCISLESVIFEENSKLSSIGNGAFFYCTNLKNVVIPTSVTKIDYQAFVGCSNIANIEIPKSVTSMGDSVFSGCTSLTIYCEAESQPSEWNSDWNPHNRPVVWGYKK